MIHQVWYNLLIAKFISLLDIRFNTFLLIQIINTLIFPCMIDTSLLLLSLLKHYFYIHWNYFTNSIFTITTLLSISLYIHHFTYTVIFTTLLIILTLLISLQFFPTWVAPNVMTFAGYICLLIDYCLIAHYDWNFTAENDPSQVINYPIIQLIIQFVIGQLIDNSQFVIIFVSGVNLLRW